LIAATDASRGVVDEQGNRISTVLPADMKDPGMDFGG
jgi:hypothetical protein